MQLFPLGIAKNPKVWFSEPETDNVDTGTDIILVIVLTLHL